MDRNRWIKKQKELLRGKPRAGIKPKRKYLHFDNRISKLTPEILSGVFDLSSVARHSFYPFIGYTQTSRRRKKTEKFTGYKKKERPIRYAAHYDTLIFSWYAYQLSSLYEQQLRKYDLEQTVLAYRSGNGSNVDHACLAFRNIQLMRNANVVCADISGFFDNLAHVKLKERWLALLKTEEPSLQKLPDDHYKVFRAITRFSVVDILKLNQELGWTKKRIKKEKPLRLCSAQEFRDKITDVCINKKNYGIPQGSSMSAFLANMYMLEFDKQIKEAMEQRNGEYYRYSDDIFLATPKNISISVLENLLSTALEPIRLTANEDKKETYFLREEHGIPTIRNAKTGNKKFLNYLGMAFDGRRVLLRHSSLAKYQRKAIAFVRSALRYHFKKNKPIPKRETNQRFTRLGKQNFQSYIQRCAITLKKYGFSSVALKRQASDFFVHKAFRNKQLLETVRQQVLRRKAKIAKRITM